MHRPVGGGETDVSEKRFIVVLVMMFANVLCRVIRDRIGVIKRFVITMLGRIHWIVKRRYEFVVSSQSVGVKETAGSVDRSVETIKAALSWPVTLFVFRFGADLAGNVPLACHVSFVACGFQSFGDRHAFTIDFAAVTVVAAIVHHVAHASLVWVQTGHKTRTSRAATRGVIKLREPQSILSQLVQVGRIDLAAVTTDIRKSHVIGHDVNDVRFVSRDNMRGDKENRQTKTRNFG